MPRRGPLGFSMSHYRDLADGWATNRGGGPAPKTYADWQAHVGALPAADWGSSISYIAPAGTFRTTAGPIPAPTVPMGMRGSPWLGRVVRGSTGEAAVARIVQHGLPSLAEFQAQQSAGGVIVFRLLNGRTVDDGVTGRDRNGFASSSDATTGLYVVDCDLVGWWDEATETALMTNPQAGTGPVPYTASGWAG